MGKAAVVETNRTTRPRLCVCHAAAGIICVGTGKHQDLPNRITWAQNLLAGPFQLIKIEEVRGLHLRSPGRPHLLHLSTDLSVKSKRFSGGGGKTHQSELGGGPTCITHSC